MADLVPLVVTDDPSLIDDAARWCAALGAAPEIARDVAAARREWRRAAVVVVGEDQVDDLARAGVSRRDHVVVVADEPARRWAAAIDVGATAVCARHDEDRLLALVAAGLDGRGEACVVSVVGGSGGAGASTLSVALGLGASRRGLRSVVVDADPLGGGVDLVLGSERADGLRWGDFAGTRGRIDATSLGSALPFHRGVATLGWAAGADRTLPSSLPGVLDATIKGFDVVVLDVPRRPDDTAAELLGRSVLSLVLVPEEIASVAAARHVLARVGALAPSTGLVSVARRGGIGAAAVADAVEMPVMARLRQDRRLRGAVDRGHGPGGSRPTRRVVEAVLDALGLERASRRAQ